jgi:hypothetical protein
MNELKRIVFSSLILFFICLFLLTPWAWAISNGEWSGTTNEGGDVFFIVNGNSVQDFSILICLSGGSGGHGCLEEFLDFSMYISGSNFSYSNFQFELTGTFTSMNTCTGTWNYHDGYMGYGNGTWSASFPAPPDILFSPLNQDFGHQAINTTGDSVTFTLKNKGGGSATGSVSLTGTNADQFEITSGGGTFTLSHGQSKDILVRFTPTSTGIKTATLLADGNIPCNDVNASLTGTGDPPNWKIIPSDGTSGDFFGKSVSISGDYAIIGAYGNDDNGINSGSAYIFKRTVNGWVQQARLIASDIAELDYFGYSVSISGNYAIVGAPYNKAAYIFEKPTGGWTDMTETAKLTASDSITVNDFGYSVSISGNYAIVGSGHTYSGSAYIFERTLSGWIQRAKLTASNGTSYDYFGSSVSISGNYAIVGACQDDDDGESSGSAYIFEKPNEGWTDMTETAKLKAGDSRGGIYFGYSVSISGGYAIVGTRYNKAAYIFEQPIEGWVDMTETAKLTAGDDASDGYFGSSVSISGNYAIVGTSGSSVSSTGSAYVFKRIGTGWIQEMRFRASDGAFGFGNSVSLSGHYATVGAINDYVNGSSTGSAYIYNFINSPINLNKGMPWIPLLLLDD